MRISRLIANPQKTAYMVIGHPWTTDEVEVSEPLKQDDSEIKCVAKAKPLKLVIDEGIYWDGQFSTIKGNVNGGIRSPKTEEQCPTMQA